MINSLFFESKIALRNPYTDRWRMLLKGKRVKKSKMINWRPRESKLSGSFASKWLEIIVRHSNQEMMFAEENLYSLWFVDT